MHGFILTVDIHISNSRASLYKNAFKYQIFNPQKQDMYSNEKLILREIIKSEHLNQINLCQKKIYLTCNNYGKCWFNKCHHLQVKYYNQVTIDRVDLFYKMYLHVTIIQ